MPTRRIRWIPGVVLLAALGGPSWAALSIVRAQRVRLECDDDTLRLMFVQRIAAEAERTANDSGAAEGARRGIVLHIESADAQRHPLREAGTMAVLPDDRTIAFAIVPSLPLLVTIAAAPAQSTPGLQRLWLIDGAPFALGLLAIARTTVDGAPAPGSERR